MTVPTPTWMSDPELGDHICLPFDSVDDYLESTIGFVRSGLRRRRQVIVFTQSFRPEAMRSWLEERVPQFAGAAARGQAVVRACADVHLAGGRFDPERTMNGFAEAIDQAEANGLDGVLVLVDMAWALRQAPGTERLLQYEAEANPVFADRRMAAVCQYDRHLFAAGTLQAACAAHPLTPGQSELRFSRTVQPAGLRLAGCADETNRDALTALLAAMSATASDLTLDLLDLSAADMTAACRIVEFAATRTPFRTTVLADERMTRLLSLLGAEELTSPGTRPEPAERGVAEG
ncbi:MAG TPA: MEDS domain-containing protein [Actinocrinis sp.]|nr:MEDS domain-containing protein [Actinocrinis sp.]